MRYSADQEKWHFLRDVPQTDRWHPLIKRLSRDLMDAAQKDTRRFAFLAHTVARDWIRQESDTERTGGEDIAGLTRSPSIDDAVDALLRGTDDCDAKARLFVAICLAAGISAEVVPYWRRVDGTTHHEPYGRDGEQLYHVAARVFLGGKWLPVELTLSRARLGEPGEIVPVEPGSKNWLKT
jgi:transglutaminase-like putative cysteine protease